MVPAMQTVVLVYFYFLSSAAGEEASCPIDNRSPSCDPTSFGCQDGVIVITGGHILDLRYTLVMRNYLKTLSLVEKACNRRPSCNPWLAVLAVIHDQVQPHTIELTYNCTDISDLPTTTTTVHSSTTTVRMYDGDSGARGIADVWNCILLVVVVVMATRL